MDLILKQLIIIASTFLVIIWFQNIDDKKHNKIRETFYDKYKFPILVSAIVGFVINIPDIISSVSGELCDTNKAEIAIFTTGEHMKHIDQNIDQNIPKISSIDFVRKNIKNIISEQQIYTELPNF
jgi:hypothetical protein